MLVTQTQFLLKQGVRSPLQLLNPPILEKVQVQPPRQSVFHYLDIESDVQFPDRDISFLSNIPEKKRIPITHVTTQVTETEVASIKNKQLSRDVREWRTTHLKTFKEINLLETPNVDIQTNAVVNYNLLKDLHNYRSSVSSRISRLSNIYKTYWSTVDQLATKSPGDQQFVQITIPAIIPTQAALTSLLKQKPSTYARVVNNPHLNNVIQMYKYLSGVTRGSSTMADLQLNNLEKVIVELSYKGYSCFFKLSDLVGLSEENTLPSKTKYKVDKVQRLFLVSLLRIQKSVTGKLEADDVGGFLSEEPNVNFPEPEGTHVLDADDSAIKEALPGETDDYAVDSSGNTIMSRVSKDSAKITESDDPEEETIDNLLDSESEEISGSTDDIFFKSIQTAQTEEQKQEESGEPESTVYRVDYTEDASKLLNEITPGEVYTSYLEEAKSSGAVSTAEIRTLRKLTEARRELKSPFSDLSIDEDRKVPKELLTVPPESFAIPIENDLVSDHLKTEVLFNSDKRYINDVLKKDVLASVTHLESAGVIIKNYEVDRVSSSVGKYDVHKLTLRPLTGKESTVYFRLPVINDEGEFTVSSVKLRLRKQKTEVVLRKISPIKVTLTTNYGKLFVQRTERRAHDKFAQIVSKIKDDYLSQTGNVKKIIPGNTFNNELIRPNAYAVMSQNFVEIVTGDYVFSFDDSIAVNRLDKPTWESVHIYPKSRPELRLIYCGHRTKDQRILVMNMNSEILLFSKDRNHEPLGFLEDLLGYDTDKLPKPFSTMKVLGDSIPMGVVLAYYLGLRNLLSVTQTKVQVLEPRKQYKPNKDEIVIRFDNAKLVVTADTEAKKLLFSGFLFYKDTTKLYAIESFDLKEVYLELLEQRDCSVIHLRELDLLRQLFIDPISSGALELQNEPKDYLKLLLRANQLLEDYSHPDPNDPKYARIRSYDRIPGLMYRALSESVRAHKFRNNGRGKIELDPYKVWNAVTRDTTVKITEESNPVIDVKEVESVTFSGADGLNKTSTPEYLRRYHPGDAGLISEATVDSSDVALNFFLTPYPKLTNLRGMVDNSSTFHTEHPDTIFSTSAQLAPMSELDD